MEKTCHSETILVGGFARPWVLFRVSYIGLLTCIHFGNTIVVLLVGCSAIL